MAEALQLWKKISGKGGDGSPDGKTPSRGRHATTVLFFKMIIKLCTCFSH